MKSLIIPIGAYKEEYDTEIPYLFRLNKEGYMYCIKAIMGLDLTFFDKIYFTILGCLDKKYLLDEMLQLQFRRLGIGDKARVVILRECTRNQPETIYRTIKDASVEGLVMIKDADSYFTCDIHEENSIATFPIDALDRINPQNKSYLAIDDMFYITNIVEKKIIGRWFSAGGYVFNSAAEYCRYYEMLKDQDRLYLSHLIYAMLLDRHTFRPIKVASFEDWGTVGQINFAR